MTDDLTVIFVLLDLTIVRTLVKLTAGFNFINVQCKAFTCTDPECTKKTVKSAMSFVTFGTFQCKSCT